MTDNSSNQKLLNAQQHLNNAIDNLEKVVLNKSRQVKQSDIANNDVNLEEQIFVLKKDLEAANLTNLQLNEQNQQLSQKVNNFKINGSKIINNIEFDLKKIRAAINNNINNNHADN